VRIGMGQYGAFALLGEPDHTSVLVRDTVSRCDVADGQSVKPADVGILTVVEHAARLAPKRDSYDLVKLQQGEVQIYRPVGVVMYLGSTLSAEHGYTAWTRDICSLGSLPVASMYHGQSGAT